ncbi:hypothetical protein ABVQ18_17870 [Snodgrassella alvi]
MTIPTNYQIINNRSGDRPRKATRIKLATAFGINETQLDLRP